MLIPLGEKGTEPLHFLGCVLHATAVVATNDVEPIQPVEQLRLFRELVVLKGGKCELPWDLRLI